MRNRLELWHREGLSELNTKNTGTKKQQIPNGNLIKLSNANMAKEDIIQAKCHLTE